MIQYIFSIGWGLVRKRETTRDISKHRGLIKEFVTQVRDQKEDAEVTRRLISPEPAEKERG